MQNFIEVVCFQDQDVIEGIVHGIWHRSKNPNTEIKEEFLRGNILGYVDVTERAADAALYNILRREIPREFLALGIAQTDSALRGRTLMRPTFIFSDNLSILSKDQLIRGLQQLIAAPVFRSMVYDSQIRFIISEHLREKFSYCIREAYYETETDKPAANQGLMPNINDLEPTVSFETLVHSFFPGQGSESRIHSLDKIVIGSETEKNISDEFIAKITGWCVIKKKPFFISPARYRKYIMRHAISISEAVV